MSGAFSEVFLVVIGCVDVGQDPGIVDWELEPLLKIAADHGSGSFREAGFQKLGKEIPTEEHGVAPPSLECRDDERSPGFPETTDEGLYRLRGEKGVVHRGEKHGLGPVG
jgi:hypothetical protein